MAKKALIIVDYQNDFVEPNGSLYVPAGETLKDYLMKLMAEFKANGDLVVATLDWHCEDHSSFAEWPVHAVAHTWGSEFSLPSDNVDYFVKKGFKQEYDSYSGFIDDEHESTGLDEYLIKHDVNKLVIVGLALDVCVSYTICDALDLEYEVEVDLQGCKGMQNMLVLRSRNKNYDRRK